MRALAWTAALALALAGLGGCSLTIDPDSVKPPVGGCTPVCAGRTCGSADDCGGTCQPGSGCTTGGTSHRVEGTVTHGGFQAVNPGGHQVRGTVDLGAAPAAPSNANHRIEQGSLR